MDQVEVEETVRMRDRLAAEIERDRAALVIKESLVQGLNDLLALNTRVTRQVASPRFNPPVHPQIHPQRRTRSGDPNHPKGIEAVRRILAESPLEKMDVKTITARLIDHGWPPASDNPENTTSSSASRAEEQIPGIQREKGTNGSYLYWYDPECASVVTGPIDSGELSLNGHHEQEVMT